MSGIHLSVKYSTEGKQLYEPYLIIFIRITYALKMICFHRCRIGFMLSLAEEIKLMKFSCPVIDTKTTPDENKALPLHMMRMTT
jgi:hypothetical protein